MDDFHGRVAVVTGAGSGIGAAMAAGLAGEGAFVVAVDIDGDAADRDRIEDRRAGPERPVSTSPTLWRSNGWPNR